MQRRKIGKPTLLALILALLALLASCSQLTPIPTPEAAEEVADMTTLPLSDDVLATTGSSTGTTFDCGGEGEKPCGIDTAFFWENGNLFADRGLKATDFKILPDISFNANEWIDLNRANITELKRLIEVEWPALEARITSLSEDDFLSDVCMIVMQGGSCWTTPPFTLEGWKDSFWTGGDCVPLKDIDFLDVLPDPNCSVSVPGIPGYYLPLPDFTAPGWKIPEDIAGFIEKLATELDQLPAVIEGIPTKPVRGFGGYSTDPDVFDPTRFLTDLESFKSFFTDNPYIGFVEDLVNDFFDPPGTVVNDTRRQQAAIDFQGTWEYWALTRQRELSKWEPLNWTQSFETHNAYNNAADGYPVPNQVYSMTDQLNMGVRSLALDIHWFNGHLRLCHGKADHQGCSLVDRYYANGIEEIGNWLRANPTEVIMIGFEDRSDGNDAYVNDPIARYLVDAQGNSLVYRPISGETTPSTHWPSLQEMRDAGKQILLFSDDTHGGQWIWTAPGNPFNSAREKNFYFTSAAYQPADGMPPAYTDGEYGCWSYWGPGENEHFDFSRVLVEDEVGNDLRDNKDLHFTTVYEARSLLDSFDPTGLLDEPEVAELARCQISLISLDMFEAKEETSPSNCTGEPLCLTRDERVESAIWSWRQNDWGTNGTAALLNASDGRWTSANAAAHHRFACGKPREGDPGTWPDAVHGDWKITVGSGPWDQGGQQCLLEYGEEGYVFSVPLIGWQHERLKLANLGGHDLWLNHVRKADDWVVNRRPVAVAGPDIASTEGAQVAFDGRGSSDPDDDSLTYHWDFGDGSTVTGAQPTHVYADDGVYTVTMTVDDGYAGAASDTLQVTIGNVAPSVAAGLDSNVTEGTPLLLPAVAFSDPGFSCATCEPSTAETFTASIDWGEGTVEAGELTVRPGRPGVATTGSVTGSHTFGDDGSYTVTITVCDDDDVGGDGCGSNTLTVTVSNVAPTQTLDETSAVTFLSGERAFVGRRGVELSFYATGDDVGSDDLAFDWSFAPSPVTFLHDHFNDGVGTDPYPSPHGTYPFTSTDEAKPAFGTPQMYDVAVETTDDDDGSSGRATLPLIVTDSRECTSNLAFWTQQLTNRGPQEIDSGRLEAYLEIVRFSSGFFDAQNLADEAAAAALLDPRGGGGPSRLARQNALAAWLNFAAGGVAWDQTIPRLDRTFHEAMAEIEATLLRNKASNSEYAATSRTARHIQTLAPNRSSCNDAGTP